MTLTSESPSTSPPTRTAGGRPPRARLLALVAKRDRYTKALAELEGPIRDAVHDVRSDRGSWEGIAHILGVHKDTARRTYQNSSIEAGGPDRRVQRCGMQHAGASGWCRNGVAGKVVRADGTGPAMDICRPHGEEGVTSGRYAWRVKPDPLPDPAQQ